MGSDRRQDSRSPRHRSRSRSRSRSGRRDERRRSRSRSPKRRRSRSRSCSPRRGGGGGGGGDRGGSRGSKPSRRSRSRSRSRSRDRGGGGGGGGDGGGRRLSNRSRSSSKSRGRRRGRSRSRSRCRSRGRGRSRSRSRERGRGGGGEKSCGEQQSSRRDREPDRRRAAGGGGGGALEGRGTGGERRSGGGEPRRPALSDIAGASAAAAGPCLRIVVSGLTPEHKLSALKAAFGHFGASEITLALRQQVAYVQYVDRQHAQKAVEILHGANLLDKGAIVVRFEGPREKPVESPRAGGCRQVFVKGLAPSVTKERITQVFADYGTIDKVMMVKGSGSGNKGGSIITFETPRCASLACDDFNGKDPESQGSAWSVKMMDQLKKKSADKAPSCSVLISGLPSFNEKDMRLLAKDWGNVVSCSKDAATNGGVIVYADAGSAANAVANLQHKVVKRSKLVVHLVD